MFSPYTGLVTFLSESPLKRGDPEVHVVAGSTADTTRYGFSDVAGTGSGAGLTRREARNAALGESLERYSFVLKHREALLVGSYRELVEQGHDPVSPAEFPVFAEHQHRHLPYPPFTPGTRMAWVQGNDLATTRRRLVPASFVYMPYKEEARSPGEQLIGVGTSTGAACAATVEEALLKGLYEVIERDAFIIVWRNRLPCPEIEVDPESGIFEIFRRRFRRPALEYRLFLTTLDLEIPSVMGMLINHRRTPPGIVVGGAAHPDPDVAALKTLKELVQGLKWMDVFPDRWFAAESGFRNVRSFRDRMRLFAFGNMLEHFDFLLEGEEDIPLSAVPSHHSGRPGWDLNASLDILKRQGLHPIGLDITPLEGLELGLRVTKVIVPGTEGIEADFRMPMLGPTRWRLVPFSLGRSPRPTTLLDLNPVPHPYP